MIGHGEKMTRKHEQAVAALLAHDTIPEAAKSVGIGEATLWRWLQTSDFREAYRKARGEVVKHAIAQVQAGMGEAVKTLRDVMTDAAAPASSRVSAARAMLDLGIKAVEVEELEARLESLEDQVLNRSK